MYMMDNYANIYECCLNGDPFGNSLYAVLSVHYLKRKSRNEPFNLDITIFVQAGGAPAPVARPGSHDKGDQQ